MSPLNGLTAQQPAQLVGSHTHSPPTHTSPSWQLNPSAPHVHPTEPQRSARAESQTSQAADWEPRHTGNVELPPSAGSGWQVDPRQQVEQLAAQVPQTLRVGPLGVQVSVDAHAAHVPCRPHWVFDVGSTHCPVPPSQHPGQNCGSHQQVPLAHDELGPLHAAPAPQRQPSGPGTQ